MVAAARRLDKAGFSPRIIAPSTIAAGAAPGYFDELIKVPGAAALIWQLAYHRYDGQAAVRALSRDREESEGLRSPHRHARARGGDVGELHTDLTVGQRVGLATVWDLHCAVGLGKGQRELSLHHGVGQGKPTLRMAARTRGLAQYFRFVRAGAVRLGASSNRSDRLPVAFRNADGTHVVVVQAGGAGAITVLGVPDGFYGLRYTTATETGRELPPVRIGAGQPVAASLPAPGVITFYQKKSH